MAVAALARAATVVPAKMGIAHRLCSRPPRVGSGSPAPTMRGRNSPGGDGGNPPTGSVTNSPEPTSPIRTPPTRRGTARGPTRRAGARPSSRAAQQYREPVRMKLARWGHPWRPQARELTGRRRQSYPGRLAPIAVKAATKSGPARAPKPKAPARPGPGRAARHTLERVRRRALAEPDPACAQPVQERPPLRALLEGLSGESGGAPTVCSESRGRDSARGGHHKRHRADDVPQIPGDPMGRTGPTRRHFRRAPEIRRSTILWLATPT